MIWPLSPVVSGGLEGSRCLFERIQLAREVLAILPDRIEGIAALRTLREQGRRDLGEVCHCAGVRCQVFHVGHVAADDVDDSPHMAADGAHRVLPVVHLAFRGGHGNRDEAGG